MLELATGLDPVEEFESALPVIAVGRKRFSDCVGVKMELVGLRFRVLGAVN